MRNLPKLLFQRVVVVSLGILLQILFVVAGMDWLREYWHWVRIAMGVISWVAVLTIMTGRSNPSYKMAWVVLILAFPVAGITIYLLFGGNKIRKLEYLLGDAREKGCDTVFTYGATQSNHAMQTVTACRRLGMEPILYLNAYVQPDENDVRSNMLLDRILGAQVNVVPGLPGETEAQTEARCHQMGVAHAARLEAEGRRVETIVESPAEGLLKYHYGR